MFEPEKRLLLTPSNKRIVVNGITRHKIHYPVPLGYALVVDYQGNYVVDYNGKYVYAKS